ncbi:MAG: long-chain fatty acid--CoA ligase [Chlorobi bacterium]|nr:long-chain fatty acid--CoA ligase [Chlorobiota bacterium]
MSLVGDFSTIAEMFRVVTSKMSGQKSNAFLVKKDGNYHSISYDRLYHDVEALGLGLRSLGFSRGDHIGLMSENRPEWVLTDFACACIGVADVPIFPILTPEQVAHVFNNANAAAVVCSNKYQLGKLLKVIDHIPSLLYVVVMQSDGLEEVDTRGLGSVSIITLEDVIAKGRAIAESSPDQLDELIKRVQPDDLLTLIYTSGTTGNPKGVMLTHRNLVANIAGAAAVMPIDDTDVVLSYLPLCHSFERMAGFYACFACGVTIAFAESIDTIVANLSEVRPTLMTTVPRFLERFKSRVENQARKKSEREQKVFNWAIETGRKRFSAIEKKGKAGFLLNQKYALADRLVFSKIRERTGGRLRFFVSGGAALPRDVGEFVFGIGLNVIEGYGLTESSPVITVNPEQKPKLGTVGFPLPNVEVKIAGDGEILARGDNVMPGYYNNPDATAEAIDNNGWLHTGDIGEFDSDGYLRITDRKKHLFVSSGGKNIAPGPIEDLLSSSPLIGQIILIGDDRPYLSALIVPDFDVLAEILHKEGEMAGDPNNPEARKAMVEAEATLTLIEANIRHLQRELSAFERIRRFEILWEEFTVENGMMTPTLKVKRKEVLKRYADLIERMYPGGKG